MKCDVCGKTIYRKYYPFENKNWCHACVEERSKDVSDNNNRDDKGQLQLSDLNSGNSTVD